MDFWNSNIVATVVGAIVGGVIAIIAGDIAYRRQRKDAEKKERWECFKHKGELDVSNGAEIPNEKIYNAQNMHVIFCSYNVILDKDGEIAVSYPKGISNSKQLKHQIVYFENIGDSDINELEIAVESPKSTVLIEKNDIDKYVKSGVVNYGILLDRKIRKGEVVSLTIYYYENDPIVNLFSASLLLFYRDALGNVCEQAVFPEQEKIYEPSLIAQKEWREHVNTNKNLELWRKRLVHASQI